MEIYDELLDVCGMNCPMPIILTRQSLKGLDVGKRLKVLATDPGTERDFEALCIHSGNKMIEKNIKNGVFAYLIEKMA